VNENFLAIRNDEIGDLAHQVAGDGKEKNPDMTAITPLLDALEARGMMGDANDVRKWVGRAALRLTDPSPGLSRSNIGPVAERIFQSFHGEFLHLLFTVESICTGIQQAVVATQPKPVETKMVQKSLGAIRTTLPRPRSAGSRVTLPDGLRYVVLANNEDGTSDLMAINSSDDESGYPSYEGPQTISNWSSP
jgi:hypothetical protein